MSHYCKHCRTLPLDNIHRIHHDTIYGIVSETDDEIFGRLILEINQAGLSWDTILKKEENFRNAYSNFDIKTIANYQEKDFERLLTDAGIIRNRLKINAAIYNANQILKIQQEYGSFLEWIKIQNAAEIQDWVKIFKKQFKFVGGEIVNEFLMTIGRIGNSHSEDCERYSHYMLAKAKWS